MKNVQGDVVDYISVPQSGTHRPHPVRTESLQDPVDVQAVHAVDLITKHPLPLVALPWDTVLVQTGSLLRTMGVRAGETTGYLAAQVPKRESRLSGLRCTGMKRQNKAERARRPEPDQ